MKLSQTLLLAAAFAVSGGAAHAAPSAFSSKCGAITIDNDTPATLLRDTEDCSLIWVLPPNAGKTQLTGFTPSANLGMCNSVKLAQGASERVLERLKKTSEDLDRLDPEVKAATAHLVAAKKKLGDTLMKAEVKQLDAMNGRLAEIEAHLEVVSGKLDACQEHCDALQEEAKSLNGERTELTRQIAKLRAQYFRSAREYDVAKGEVEAAQEELADVGRGVETVMSKQKAYNKDLLDLLVVYSRIEGGYALLDYDTQWDAAITSLTARFGSQYQFRRVPTKEARIFANIVGAANESSYLSSMPSILDYSIAGIKYMPFGEEKQPELAALPSHFGGNVRLSLMGACPLYYKDYLTSNELRPSGTAPDSWNFAISTTYKFPAAYKLKMTASYNLFKFYEKIVESSSSGGLFSSHSATSISETNLSRDTFSIDWLVEDPDSKYDEQTRQDIAKELKLDLIGRVLGTMAQPTFQNVPQPSVAPQQGHGAVVLADGLQSTCGMVNVWCTAGSWLLRGLDAIFGSNSATNSYRSTHDHTATDTWSANATKWNTGATLFTNVR